MEEQSNTSNNNDKDLKLKFIKENINNENYNDFISFCLSKKENGDNINNWALEELKLLVQEFNKNNNLKDEEDKEEFNINNIDNDNNNDNENIIEDDENINIENEIEELKKNNPNEENKDKDNDINNNIKHSNKNNKSKRKDKKEKIIKCKTLQKTILNDKNITIIIKDPKEMGGGLFSKKYILYTIETQPMGWTIQRRYSDFIMLRKLLIKHFPFRNIPPIQNKKDDKKSFDKDYTNKRINYLNNFINNIIKNETLKASEILVSFLSLEDRNAFDIKFKEFNNQITGNENLEEYKTLNGELTVLYDEKNKTFFDNIHKYLKSQDEIFNKLNKNLKLFYKNIVSTSENMNEIINNLGILYNINTNVLMKETITNAYEGLQNLFKGWKKIIINQNNIIKTRIKNFFKYINLVHNSYKDIIEKRYELNKKFNNENKKLKFKKEKLFLYRDINKFEIDKDIHVDNQRLLKDKKYAFRMMCTNETKNITKMYKILGYGNQMVTIELKEMIKDNCNKYTENFQQFEKEFNTTINEVTEIWNKYESSIIDINNKTNKNKKSHKHKAHNENNEIKNDDNNNINNIDENINTNINSNNI